MSKKSKRKKLKKKPVKATVRRRKKSAKKKNVRKKHRRKLKKRKAKEGPLDLQVVNELMEKGVSRRFVTYSEILHYFPEIEKNIKGLEFLYEELEKKGIEVKEAKIGRASCR